MIKTAIVYIAAAFFEIAGYFSFWAWIRDGKSGLWVAPGIVSLLLFAWLFDLRARFAAERARVASAP